MLFDMAVLTIILNIVRTAISNNINNLFISKTVKICPFMSIYVVKGDLCLLCPKR